LKAKRARGWRADTTGPTITGAAWALSLYNHPASVAVSTDGKHIAVSAHEASTERTQQWSTHARALPVPIAAGRPEWAGVARQVHYAHGVNIGDHFVLVMPIDALELDRLGNGPRPYARAHTHIHTCA
jgi:hypothetical protein